MKALASILTRHRFFLPITVPQSLAYFKTFSLERPCASQAFSLEWISCYILHGNGLHSPNIMQPLSIVHVDSIVYPSLSFSWPSLDFSPFLLKYEGDRWTQWPRRLNSTFQSSIWPKPD